MREPALLAPSALYSATVGFRADVRSPELSANSAPHSRGSFRRHRAKHQRSGRMRSSVRATRSSSFSSRTCTRLATLAPGVVVSSSAWCGGEAWARPAWAARRPSWDMATCRRASKSARSGAIRSTETTPRCRETPVSWAPSSSGPSLAGKIDLGSPRRSSSRAALHWFRRHDSLTDRETEATSAPVPAAAAINPVRVLIDFWPVCPSATGPPANLSAGCGVHL